MFVYEKNDVIDNNIEIISCRFVNKSRTADFQTTTGILNIINNKGNSDDIKAFLMDRNLPVDEVELENIVNEILTTPIEIGYLTISNALQWRLQYGRIIALKELVIGLEKIYDKSFTI